MGGGGAWGRGGHPHPHLRWGPSTGSGIHGRPDRRLGTCCWRLRRPGPAQPRQVFACRPTASTGHRAPRLPAPSLPATPCCVPCPPPPPFPFISSEKPFPVGLRPPRQPAGTPRGCEAGGWVGWATPPTATGAVSPPSCVCRPPPPSLLLSKPRGVSLRPRGALLWVGRWGLNSPTPRHQSPESL